MGSSERGALKKLAAAALHWLGVGKPAAQPFRLDEGVADGLRRMGVSEEDIERAQAAEVQAAEVQAAPADDFEVHEDCWESWAFFLKVERCWVYVPLATGLGSRAVRVQMDWPAVEAVARMTGVKRARMPALHADLKLIEDAVMAAEEAKQQG